MAHGLLLGKRGERGRVLPYRSPDANGIEFVINVPIKVPATRKPLRLILRTRFARGGEFARFSGLEEDKRLWLIRRWHVQNVIVQRVQYVLNQ